MSSIEAGLRSALKTCAEAQKDLDKSTPQLKNALSNSAAKGLPTIAIAPHQGAQLQILCQMASVKNILEIGTLGGYSTMWFATSVPGVQVTSIEYNSKHRDVALENLQGLDNVEVHLGAALDILPQLADQGKTFDFVFIDADWANQERYFDWAVKLLRPKGVIYVDNVVRQITGGEDDESKGRALIDSVKNDDRVLPALVPTLSTHKVAADELVDGYLLAIKK
ncbi:O-methyltransferase imqG [Pseudocercospora fuligena]|uniref:O-methyltransferase imqG n=1 Tax=Pseudocercospora fuligena TaxID=685502 RepID=A0A8H6RR76_9PEZI|nr:O-methyltransferase imqG [Pseudocercospora fuligena]